MKILVPIKRVIDPYVTVQIDNTNGCVKTDNVKMAMNPFDEIAVEEAIRIKEAQSANNIEIIVVTIGCKASQEILRHGLALGADKAIHIEADQRMQPLSIAKILQKIATDEDCKLVIMGKQTIDGDNNQTGQMLAAMLDWPQATFASKLTINDNTIEVVREVDAGLETVSCSIPAVVTTDLRLNVPRYASLPNIMKAKSKPLDHKLLDDLGLTLNEDLEQVSVALPPVRKAGIIVESVDELVANLKDKEQVI